MPAIQTTQPYDSVETVFNNVRVILADYIKNASTMSGDIFADSQVYALPTLNLAWRKLQRKLALAGHARLEPTVTIQDIPPVNVAVATDPATEVYITWTGFFDGVQLLQTPTLPADLIFPIKIGERQDGTVADFYDMHPATDGLPSIPPGAWFRWWDWRGLPGGGGEGLYFKGSVLSIDLRMRYAAFMPDIVMAQGGLSQTLVPFMRCAEALAYYIAAIFVSPREGGIGKAAEYEQEGDKALSEILALPSKQILQRANFRRQPFGGRHSRRIYTR